MKPISTRAYRKLRFTNRTPTVGDRVFLHKAPTGILGTVMAVHDDPYVPVIDIELSSGQAIEMVPRSNVRVVSEMTERTSKRETMKITKRQLRRIIREAARNEGWFLMAPDGTLAKSVQLNKPIWWPSESRAQQAYDAGYGAEDAKPVALALVLDDYGYNGYGPDPQDLQFARESRGLMGEGTDYDPMGYEAWVEERGHITPSASSVIASYLTEFGLEPDGEEARRLAQEYGVDLRNISMAVRRERVERALMDEGADYDPMGDEGVPHVGVGPKYALAFIDASYGDRRMELVVDERDAELARVVMKKLRKQGQTSGVQPTRQRFHPSEVTSREELLRLVSEPMSESIDYSFQNWWEYGFTDARNGDPPNPPDRPLEARDAYEDGYQEGLDLRVLMGNPLESMSESSWRDPINLPSIDSLEAAGREGMASYGDIEAAREILPELEEYMEYNYRATLEDAADAWLEAHGYDDPGSPLAPIRDEQREFVIRVGKQRELDKI